MSVMDLPLHLVEPLKVKYMKALTVITIAMVMNKRVKAWNCSAYKFFLTYSIKT